MGYAKGIKWNDDLIKREILEVKNALGIDSMPSYSQIKSVRKSDDLSVKIGRTGGITRWAKELGLEIVKSESRIGLNGEKIVEELLKLNGYSVINTSKNRFPYDLLVNNDVKIDVKLSHLNKSSNGNYYSCNLEKINPTCDIYIIICEKNNKLAKVLVIPSKFLHITQLCFGEKNSKYNKYINRWDYVEQYDRFYKSIE